VPEARIHHPPFTVPEARIHHPPSTIHGGKAASASEVDGFPVEHPDGYGDDNSGSPCGRQHRGQEMPELELERQQFLHAE